MRWFWKWALQLDEEMQRNLLLFWSGSSTPPLHGFLPISDNGFDLNDEDRHGLFVMADTKKKGKVKDKLNAMLPTAST